MKEDKDTIVPGCPSLMPHMLPGGIDGVEPGEDSTPLPEPKDFAANAKLHLVHALTKHPYFAEKIYDPRTRVRGFDVFDRLDKARLRLKRHTEHKIVDSMDVLDCEILEIVDAYITGHPDKAISECYDAIAVLMRMIMFFEGTQKLGNPPTKGLHD